MLVSTWRFSVLDLDALQAPAIGIRRCLSAGGCCGDETTPDYDFMDEEDWGGAVKVASPGDDCGTEKQGGRSSARACVCHVHLLNVNEALH